MNEQNQHISYFAQYNYGSDFDREIKRIEGKEKPWT